MQSLTERVLKIAPPGGLFNETVVRNLFPDASEGARKLLVYRAVKRGDVLRLKPGLFVLERDYRKTDPHPYVIAAMLHAPSHISLESALAHHGLIPEAVQQVSSVTALRSRTFTTPLGVFTFQRVPARIPRAGVESAKIGARAWAFIATPLRAIADLVYLNKAVSWESDELAYLLESLRIEENDLFTISTAPLPEICDSIRDRRVSTYLDNLALEVTHAE